MILLLRMEMVEQYLHFEAGDVSTDLQEHNPPVEAGEVGAYVPPKACSSCSGCRSLN